VFAKHTFVEVDLERAESNDATRMMRGLHGAYHTAASPLTVSRLVTWNRKSACFDQLSPRCRFFLLAMLKEWTTVLRSLTIGLWLPNYCS
jgi:hypothetical protein